MKWNMFRRFPLYGMCSSKEVRFRGACSARTAVSGKFTAPESEGIYLSLGVGVSYCLRLIYKKTTNFHAYFIGS